MEGSCDNSNLLSMSFFLASSTVSTAAATELVGGRLIGGEVGGGSRAVGLAVII